MSDHKDKELSIEIEVEIEQELQVEEKDFKRDLDKVILTDKSKLEDSEKE